MNQYNKRGSYDDMNSSSRFQEEDRKVKVMRRVVTLVVVLLILTAGAVGVLLVVGTNTGSPETSREETASELEDLRIASPRSSAELLEVEPPEAAPRTTDSAQSGDEQPPAEETPTAAADEADTDTDASVEEESEDPAPSDDEEETDSEQVSFTSYTVEEGDTVRSIASSFALRPETIVGVNEITDINQISAGRELRIPDRDGQLYTVQPGDSLSVIAYEYGMGYVRLAEVNGLTSSLIRVGQELFIPDRTISTEEYQQIMNTLFVSPAEGTVQVRFGEEVEDIVTGELYNLDGIRIVNSRGTPVRAARAGMVEATGNEPSGLGRTITVSHDNGYSTIYGHLDSIDVSVGEQVEQGQRIAAMGSTGRILDSMLYFSLRRSGTPVDPAEFF